MTMNNIKNGIALQIHNISVTVSPDTCFYFNFGNERLIDAFHQWEESGLLKKRSTSSGRAKNTTDHQSKANNTQSQRSKLFTDCPVEELVAVIYILAWRHTHPHLFLHLVSSLRSHMHLLTETQQPLDIC